MSQRHLRVLGVDPGLTRCGLGVIDGPPSRPSSVAFDCVRTGSDVPVAERLVALHRAIAAAIVEHEPDVVACERVLFSSNARTAMGVGQAAGVALLAAAEVGIPVASYSPNDVKLAVAGHGAADKDAVARMVVAQLKLGSRPTPVDVTDALAVALTHLARARVDAATSGDGSAAAQLAEAAAQASQDGRGGWEATIAGRNIVGGTKAGRTANRTARGGSGR